MFDDPIRLNGNTYAERERTRVFTAKRPCLLVPGTRLSLFGRISVVDFNVFLQLVKSLDTHLLTDGCQFVVINTESSCFSCIGCSGQCESDSIYLLAGKSVNAVVEDLAKP